MCSAIFISGCGNVHQITQTNLAADHFDMAIVSSDAKGLVDFYVNALGFCELSPFTIDQQKAAAIGFSDNGPMKVHVLSMGDKEGAGKLKIIEMENTCPAMADNRFVDSMAGYSFMTVFVKDIDKTVDDVQTAGGAIVKEPYNLRENKYLVLVRDPDGNTIEVIGYRL